MQQTNPASFVWKGWKGTKHGLTYVTHSCWWHFHSSNILLPASNSPKMSLLANSMVRSCQDLGCQMCFKKKIRHIPGCQQQQQQHHHHHHHHDHHHHHLHHHHHHHRHHRHHGSMFVTTSTYEYFNSSTSRLKRTNQDLDPWNSGNFESKKKNSLLETEEWSSFC